MHFHYTEDLFKCMFLSPNTRVADSVHWGRARELAFLTSSQTGLLLLLYCCYKIMRFALGTYFSITQRQFHLRPGLTLLPARELSRLLIILLVFLDDFKLFLL